MGYLTALAGGVVVLPLVVRDSSGTLVTPADARYQIRDHTGAVIRPFPASGSDFTALAVGVMEASTLAPGTADTYTVEYEATIGGTLIAGEPDVLVVASSLTAATRADILSLGSPLQSTDPRIPGSLVASRQDVQNAGHTPLRTG